jgi:hypothetical protein
MNEQQAYEEYQAGIDEAQGQEAEAMAALSAQAEAEARNANAQAMNDILLTPERIEQERTKADEAFRKAHESDFHLSWGDYWQNWLLRAQVAQVMRWLDDNEDLTWSELRQALRAAGGG